MAVLVFAQENEFTGRWQATLNKGDRTGTAIMDVTLSGTQVTGTLSDPSGQIWQIENGRLEGNQLAFDVTAREHGGKKKIHFFGEVTTDVITLQNESRGKQGQTMSFQSIKHTDGWKPTTLYAQSVRNQFEQKSRRLEICGQNSKVPPHNVRQRDLGLVSQLAITRDEDLRLCVQRQAAAVCVLLRFFRLCILTFEVGEGHSSESLPSGFLYSPDVPMNSSISPPSQADYQLQSELPSRDKIIHPER